MKEYRIYVDIIGSHEIPLGLEFKNSSDRGERFPQTEDLDFTPTNYHRSR